MKKSIKACLFFFLLFSAAMLLAACETSRAAYTFQLETGDSIEVAADVKAGYELSGEIPFSVTKEEKTIFTGNFLSRESYDEYYSVITEGGQSMKALEETFGDDYSYLFYCADYDGTTSFGYLYLFKNADTAVLLEGAESEEGARNAFFALSFALK